ncbi:MAG: hypothetical protein ACYCX6_04620 [Vulcanimicrobiaceae bacterium]
MSDEERRACEDLFGTGVAEYQERGLRLIVLPTVTMPTGCDPSESSGIYVASPLGGYETRLFLERPVRLRSGAMPAITTEVLLGRTMFAASIQGVSARLPIHQAVLAHLARYESVA